MANGTLGKEFPDKTVIFRQGDIGDNMYVILEGKVEIYTEKGGREVSLTLRRAGEFIGEMALLTREVRSANARAAGPVRLLSLDKKNFLSRVHEDPTIALRLVELLSLRLRESTEEVRVLTHSLHDCLDAHLDRADD